MIRRKGLLAIAVMAALVLGLACSQAATPTPTSPPGQTPTAQTGAPIGGERPGGTGTPFLGTGSLEASGFAAFAAPQYSNGSQQMGIWVGGLGRVAVVPDLAILSLGVEAKALTVEKARTDAATAMSNIMKVLKDGGIKDLDIQTQYFNIQPEYTWNDSARKQELTGYRVSNTVTVKVRDLNNVGTLIDKVTVAGGDFTRINGIGFTVEDPARFSVQAREAAVKDALAKAQQFATLTGVKLGKLSYIAETGASIPVARDYAEAKVAFAGAAPQPPTPISQGEMDITVSVQAVFAIE